MFTIKLKVPANRLAATIEHLRPISSDVTVTADKAAQLPSRPGATAARHIAKKATVKAKPHEKGSATPAGGQSQVARAAAILRNNASQFTAKDYLGRTGKQGINKASAYKAIREAITAGHLERVEPGLFQPTSEGLKASA